MVGYFFVGLVLACSVIARVSGHNLGCGYVYIADDDALVTLGQCQVHRDYKQDTRKVKKYRCDSEVLRLDEWEEDVAELNAKKDCRASDLDTATTVGQDVSGDFTGYYDCGTQEDDDVCTGIKWERKMWNSNDCDDEDGERKVHEFRFALEVCGVYDGKGHEWFCDNPACDADSADNCDSTVHYKEFDNTDCSGTGTVIRTETQAPYGAPPVCVNGKSLDVDCPMAFKPL